jgi:hypothetical protein
LRLFQAFRSMTEAVTLLVTCGLVYRKGD